MTSKPVICKTVADLRQYLAKVDPTLKLQTQLPDYDAGIELVVIGTSLHIRARKDK